MDYLDKGEMLTNRDVNKCVHKMREISVLCLCTFSGILLFQFMKHGTNTLDVEFIFLFNINTCKRFVVLALKLFYLNMHANGSHDIIYCNMNTNCGKVQRNIN